MFITQKAAVLNKDGKVLALRRTETAPSRPLKWDLPGGELDEGENPYESIRREIREECGIEVSDLELIDAHAKHNRKGEFWITLGYRAIARSEDVTLSYEHDQLRWVTPAEFLSLGTASQKLTQLVSALKEN